VERPPVGQAGGGGSSPNLLADGKGGKTGTTAAFSDEVGVLVARVGRERKLKRKCIQRKRRQGGCSGRACMREARRGEGGIGNAVASLDTGRSETADRNGF
jgi:hypothetical protein